MSSEPIFPVSTLRTFYDLQIALHSKDPEAIKRFIAAHPVYKTFVDWARSAPWTASYAEERYNGLDTFLFVDAADIKHAVRWSFVPTRQPVSIAPDKLAKLGPGFLEQEITQRVADGPQHCTLLLTIADPSDPTADPNKAWPAHS